MRALAAIGAAVLLAAPASAGGGWAALRRALHLPRVTPGAACPVSRVDPRVPWRRINAFGGTGVGPGPAYPVIGPSGRIDLTRDEQYGSSWQGTKVFWYVAPSYRGPVLLRGRRLDGAGRLGFDGRRVPDAELQIEPGESVSWQGQPPGGRGIPSGVRALASGCYGVQLDGTTFSRVVVFRVETTRY